MLFSSTVFLFFFFPCVFIVYYLLKCSRKLQNGWLFFASLFFYAWGEPIYVLLMIASIGSNWFAGYLLGRAKENEKRKKLILRISIVGNIGVLFFFKYLNFIIRNLNSALEGRELKTFNLLLPIGISFFTFQAMSYVIDVYRGDVKAEKNPFYVGLYIAFFPQLIAGPIVRFKDIALQIRDRKETFRKCSVGVCRFVCGLGKKVLLANNMAILADYIFSFSSMGQNHFEVPILMAWLGCIAYTLQIYFDFSGYSDMAIGLGLIFGFQFNENFNYPYAAVSITDFWKRWHISLTSWFREYVYFPLGGSRVENSDKVLRNLLIVWLLTGIWHGAEWTFLLWGLWHFVFQMAERFLGYAQRNEHGFLMRIYTLLVVSLGWVLFRAQDLYQAGQYFLNMFGANQNAFSNPFTMFLIKEYGVFLVLAAFFSFPWARRINTLLVEEKMGKIGIVYQVLYPIVFVGIFLLSVTYLVRGSYNPFIYFNF